ncbi:MAG: peptidase C13 [Proteobacteria bacterium]|nr:peptidase C13 [Pseudomonadota bacterium]
MKAWVFESLGQDVSSALPPPPRPKTEWERYGHYLWIMILVVLLGGAAFAAEQYFAADSYSNWAAIVVAGDYHAHNGADTEAFDNARRDIAAKLHDIGFSPDNIVQFSVRPERYRDTQPLSSDVGTISRWLWTLSGQAHGGCLVYFTSHGAPQGLVLGNSILSPDSLENIVDTACGDRPTVVILSACYSGVFVPALKGANRMIMTAARPDRTSFGCTSSDRYPYFDACLLDDLPDVHGFPELADRVKDCVTQREQESNVSPPSEPQVSLGDDIAAHLPGW